ncbi:MAG: hypothetical protein C0516_05760 [Gemmatimonas sp.]|nr:hypothetical protein [Gemmatimonas sp.]
MLRTPCVPPRSWSRVARSATLSATLSAALSATTLAAVCAASLVALVPAAAAAQAVTGVGEDAIPVPRGSLRIGTGGLWNDYREAWSRESPGGAYGRGPLLGALNTDRLGTGILATLSDAELALRTLTGQSTFQLSMGPLEARGQVRQSIAPITLDYGVTRRFSVRLVVPYVESRDATQFVLNRTGLGANVGANPAFGTTGAAARAINGSLVTQIATARTQLAAEITRCADVAATGCDAIRADPARAQALLGRAQDIRSALLTVYGDASRGGAPVVPITGSALHTTIVGTMTSLRDDFTAFGVSALTATGPSPAALIYGPAGITNIASDTAFGVGYERLGDTRRAGIGDIDLTATWLLWDTFRADQVARLLAPRRGIRSAISAGWRFGTAGADRTEDAFDVPIGEGANALLLRSTTDLLLNNWAWMSATLRVVRPLEDEIVAIVPPRDIANTFSGPISVGATTRSLGQRMDIELMPRVAVGSFFGLAAGVIHRRWSNDQYSATPIGETPSNPAITSWTVPSRSLTSGTVGVTFSSLASYARRRSRIPAEVIYTHQFPLSGSGGFVPAVSSDRLELRVYTGFPRR